MNRLILSFSVLFLSFVYGVAQPVLLHTRGEMNHYYPVGGSHAGMEQWSSLEPVQSLHNVLSPSQVLTLSGLPAEQKAPCYPNIFHMRDGRFGMIYQGGPSASRIYAMYSDDLKSWYGRQQLWGPVQVVVDGEKQHQRNSSPGVISLRSGELVCISAFRSDKGYLNGGHGCGLMMKRSRDCGLTWSQSVVIYSGACWDPFIMELPDGRLQCYFSDSKPRYESYSYSVIESFDGGYTWGVKTTIGRQFKFFNNGVRVYTDYNPRLALLSDGRTMFGITGGRTQPDGPGTPSIYQMSLIRNDGWLWSGLAGEQEGPSDKQKNAFLGKCGDVAVFPSGEVVVSALIDKMLSIKLGSADAKNFTGGGWDNGWYRASQREGDVQHLRVWDANHLIWAQDCSDGIEYGVMWLNHVVSAHTMTPTVDGNTAEWPMCESLFLGSDTNVEAVFRFSNDAEYLYIGIDALDNQHQLQAVNLSFCNGSSKSMSKGKGFSLVLNGEGVTSSKGISLDMVSCVVSKARTMAGDRGFVAEIKVPLSALSLSQGDMVAFYASLDGDKFSDIFTGTNKTKVNTWQRVKLDL